MNIEELLEIQQQNQARLQQPKKRVRCCTAGSCLSYGAKQVKASLEEEVEKAGLTEEIEVCSVGCLRFCGGGALVAVDPDDTLYEQVKPEHASALIASLHNSQVAGELPSQSDTQHPFFTRQQPIVLENIGKIDPESIEDYIGTGGYQALHQVLLEMNPEEVIGEVTTSGLRGRGGGRGYPTGLKWATVAKMPRDQKYVICNADEGFPGAFLDRAILESDPHRVLEGMAIAGYAVGANHGYIYTRAEYPLAIERLEKAIKQAKRAGLLGAQIFDSPFDFKIDIRVGAGAFICGEETALIASIEGKRGTPSPRPPYPAESGLYGAPTLVNNVETYANIAPIIVKGGEWYGSIGTPSSKGTKVIALTGKVEKVGLIEVPMGTTVGEIVEEIGGGVPQGGKVKAVQTGGPSGGCIPASLLDTPVAYDSLQKIGALMGSGGMIVMDDTTDMVEIARFYMKFCRDESCGKCIPCRAGTVQLHELLTKITQGKANQADLATLESLCYLVQETSLCGLGICAPNPVISTLEYFREEYLNLVSSN